MPLRMAEGDARKRMADAIRAATGAATLEQAFSRMTGVRDVARLASEFISALERA